MPDRMLTAVEHLTTQVRRIADALTTTATRAVTDAATTRQTDCGLAPPPVDEEQLRTARRDSLGILLSRTGRGLTNDEEVLLRQHVEAEMRGADTARLTAELADTVTAETKRLMERRTTTLRQRAEQAEATIERVNARVLAHERRLVGGWTPDTTTRSAVAREFRAALDGTEQPATEE